jgi:MFS family permease
MLRNFGPTNRLLMMSVFVWSLSVGLWYNQRQIYLSELGAAPEQIGTALALEAICAALVMVPAGFLSDRLGPRRVILGAWSVGVVGVVLMALARSWHTAIPGLVLYRFAAAASPAIMSFALLSLPGRGTPGMPERTLSTIWAAWPAAQIASPWLGGVISQNASIRTTLCVAAATLAIGIGFVLLTQPAEAECSPYQRRPFGMLRDRQFLLLTGYFAFTTTVLYVGHMLLPSFLQETRGFSLATIGFLFTVSSLGAVVWNLVAGRQGPRWSFVGLLVLAWLSYLALWRTAALWPSAVAMFLLGALPALWIVMNASIVQIVGERDQGQAFGFFQSLAHAGPAVAAWMAGQLYPLTPGHDLPLVAALIGIPVMLALWFVLRLGPRPSAPTSTQRKRRRAAIAEPLSGDS